MAKTDKPVVIIVAALVPSLGIGYQGTMPWRLRQEMKYFKTVTSRVSASSTGAPRRNAVIMGRKTWESIPRKFRPLPDRLNIVLSRQFENSTRLTPAEEPANNDSGASSSSDTLLFNDLEAAIEHAQGLSEIERVYIIGGAEIYNIAIANRKVRQVLLTEIESDREVPMDTFLRFPLYSEHGGWARQSRARLQEFVGAEVPLPGAEGIQEKGFRYNFSLWARE